eukprot:GFUD01056192.1.p1 GENE.GFUD01056192.1~~GFUD01056192.1.p1  ORF type:complete len:224 (+),score=56.75 GFUD01056192.1:76-672(+)
MDKMISDATFYFLVADQKKSLIKDAIFLSISCKRTRMTRTYCTSTGARRKMPRWGLTFTILGLIFMSNGKVSDDTLFKFLKLLGVFEEERAKKTGRGADQAGDPVDPEVSELFDGDTKKFVNDILVGRQHYLKRDRVQGPDPEVEAYEYSWGERAEFEVKKSDVLKMVCELYECEPRMFKEQYDKVKEAEGDDALDTE